MPFPKPDNKVKVNLGYIKDDNTCYIIIACNLKTFCNHLAIDSLLKMGLKVFEYPNHISIEHSLPQDDVYWRDLVLHLREVFKNVENVYEVE